MYVIWDEKDQMHQPQDSRAGWSFFPLKSYF